MKLQWLTEEERMMRILGNHDESFVVQERFHAW
jgi:hypothetical protein